MKDTKDSPMDIHAYHAYTLDLTVYPVPPYHEGRKGQSNGRPCIPPKYQLPPRKLRELLLYNANTIVPRSKLDTIGLNAISEDVNKKILKDMPLYTPQMIQL